MGNKYYRLLQTPQESWKPYRLEPINEEHPELGSFKSTIYLSSPQEGDYLIQSADGSIYAQRPSYLEHFDDAQFDAMPPLRSLMAKGMIMEVPEKLARLDFYYQDKMSDLRWELFDAENLLEDLERDMQQRRFGFPTKEAREAKRQFEELKPQVEALNTRYSKLEAAYNEKVSKFLTQLMKQNLRKKSASLVHRIDEAEKQQKQAQVQKDHGQKQRVSGHHISSSQPER